MGCASSHFLNHDEDFTQLGSSALGHHIVSLTSTTYGLLTLDPSSSKNTVSPTLRSIFPAPVTESTTEPPPEVINSWELMAGLDSTAESFRLYPQQPSKRYTQENTNPQEKSNIYHKNPIFIKPLVSKTLSPELMAGIDSTTESFRLYPQQPSKRYTQENKNPQEISDPDHKNQILIKPQVSKTLSLDNFENLCPPKGENRVVVYTTSLRGVRKTFEECNAVRAVMEGYGVFVCERDISMDQGFREELRDLMKGKDTSELVPPRVFVKGRYVGGVVEVLKTMEDGSLCQLLEGLPKLKAGYVCEGCGGVRFLPCFSCNGSCKMVVDWKEESGGGRRKRVVVRCGDCNENGLVHCPVCS